jgi:hypothetical protein
MDDSRVRKASDLLGSLLAPDVAAKADGWSRFFSFWMKAAGESLAAHSRPVDVRNGIVYVEATHPGWIQLLQMEQNRILETIRRTFPELGISGIAFKLAKDDSLPGTARITRAGSPETAAAGGLSPARKADDNGRGFEERARARSGRKSEKMPTVAQTIRGVADDSFRGILSSLASTLDEANRETGSKAAAAKDGHDREV